MTRWLVLFVLAAAFLPSHSIAQTNVNAKIVLHLASPGPDACDRPEASPPCAGLVTAGVLENNYYAYVLVVDADRPAGVAAVQFGIDYNGAPGEGVDIVSWTPCAYLQFPSSGWPAPGTGNRLTWGEGNCQRFEPGGVGTGVVATVGYFYLSAHSRDQLSITRWLVGAALLADCSPRESPPITALGSIGFSADGDNPGYGPCDGVGEPPSCGISGKYTNLEEEVSDYFAADATWATNFNWSVSGNGQIIGSSTNSSVRVQAGLPGSFTLTLSSSGNGYSLTCDQSVSVLPVAPICTIQGPSNVIVNTNNTYVVNTTPSAVHHIWSISGDGTIAGSNLDSSVTVQAGSINGSYTLSLTFITGSSTTGTCQKTVTVGPVAPVCVISGPAFVTATGRNYIYEAADAGQGATYAWSVTGGSSIVGPSDGISINITARPTGGPFAVQLTTTTPQGGISSCQKSVVANEIVPGQSGGNSYAKILIHLVAPTSKNACTRSSALPACNQVRTQGNLYPELYYAHVLVADGSATAGVSAVTFGIEYTGPGSADGTGVDIYSWNGCGNSSVPSANWPNSGTGNRIAWNMENNCQRYEPAGVGTGVTANAGYFYMAAYTPGHLKIVVPPGSPAKVEDCHGLENWIEGNGISPDPSRLGVAGFGGTPSYNPCGATIPVIPTTWSGVKTLYH